MLFTFLLTIHLICAALWLGGAVYERIFLVGNIRRLRGTGQELGLVNILLSTGRLFLPATFVLLTTGIIMSIVSGGGFFQLSWLGLKQAVMLLIMLAFVLFIGPRMKKLQSFLKDDWTNSSSFWTSESERAYRSLLLG